MKALLAAEPLLNTKANQVLLKSLEAALVPSKAKPGTVERMIDDLTDMCSTFRWDDDYGWDSDEESDPRYTRLAQMGFAAVPALIEHLEDGRLTRSINFGDPNRLLQVKHIASELLQRLAGEDAGKLCCGDNKVWSRKRKPRRGGKWPRNKAKRRIFWLTFCPVIGRSRELSERLDAEDHRQEIRPAPTETLQDDPGNAEGTKLAGGRGGCQEFAACREEARTVPPRLTSSEPGASPFWPGATPET